jgi:hypothetical protein
VTYGRYHIVRPRQAIVSIGTASLTQIKYTDGKRVSGFVVKTQQLRTGQGESFMIEYAWLRSRLKGFCI